MENIKRKTKSAAILNIVTQSLYLLMSLLLAYASFVTLLILFSLIEDNVSLNTKNLFPSIVVIITTLARLVLGILAIIFSAKAIKLNSLNIKQYQEKSKLIKTNIIINISIIIVGIIAYFLGGRSTGSLFDVICWFLMGISALIYALDLRKNKKLMETETNQIEDQSDNNEIK